MLGKGHKNLFERGSAHFEVVNNVLFFHLDDVCEYSRETSDLLHDLLRVNFILLLVNLLSILEVFCEYLILETEVLQVLCNISIEVSRVASKHK